MQRRAAAERNISPASSCLSRRLPPIHRFPHEEIAEITFDVVTGEKRNARRGPELHFLEGFMIHSTRKDHWPLPLKAEDDDDGGEMGEREGLPQKRQIRLNLIELGG